MKTKTLEFDSAVKSEDRKEPMYGDVVLYNPRSKTFICEASEIGLSPGDTIDGLSVYDINTDVEIHFEFSHVDHSGEDIAGWRYKSVDGKFPTTLLIIND